jgi:hypothetical protein
MNSFLLIANIRKTPNLRVLLQRTFSNVPKDDSYILGTKIDSLQIKIGSIDTKVDNKLLLLDAKLDAKFNLVETKITSLSAKLDTSNSTVVESLNVISGLIQVTGILAVTSIFGILLIIKESN